MGVASGMYPVKELGSATPASVEQLASAGSSGQRTGNVWRDFRSHAGISEEA